VRRPSKSSSSEGSKEAQEAGQKRRKYKPPKIHDQDGPKEKNEKEKDMQLGRVPWGIKKGKHPGDPCAAS